MDNILRIITVAILFSVVTMNTIDSKVVIKMACTRSQLDPLQSSAKTGTITSGPPALYGYESRISCHLNLKTQSNRYRIRFSRKKFLLDTVDDYLSIDGKEYKNRLFPAIVISKKSAVIIYFKTDGDGEMDLRSQSGFEINFEQVAYCGEPKIANGTYSAGDYIEGSNPTLSCSPGYKQTGVNTTIQCNQDGTWSNSTAKCQPIALPRTPIITMTTEQYLSTAPPKAMTTTVIDVVTEGTTVTSGSVTEKNQRAASTSDEPDNTGLICGIIVAVVVVIIIIIVALVLWRRKKKQKKANAPRRIEVEYKVVSSNNDDVQGNNHNNKIPPVSPPTSDQTETVISETVVPEQQNGNKVQRISELYSKPYKTDSLDSTEKNKYETVERPKSEDSAVLMENDLYSTATA